MKIILLIATIVVVVWCVLIVWAAFCVGARSERMIENMPPDGDIGVSDNPERK